MSRPEAELFNEYYFAHSCGRPYQRDDHWLGFFDNIAKKIAEEIQPGSVLDAGCAMGFLVEKLREREIEAFGIDISEYAIAEVHPSVQEYCHLGSVTDPLPRRYDLIVCIEVLEHLNPADGKKAIENFCQNASMVLFSSTPLDYKEATHFNVQPPDYWAGIFAQQGFFRDVDFDASFITPWAMFLSSQEISPERIVRNFERKLWQLKQETAELREVSLEMRNTIAEAQSSLKDFETLLSENQRLKDVSVDLEERINKTEAEISELKQGLVAEKSLRRETEMELRNRDRALEEEAQKNLYLRSEIEQSERRIRQLEHVEKEKDELEEQLDQSNVDRQRVEGELTELESHIGWKLVTRVQRMRIKLVPQGSKRERMWKDWVAFFHAWLDLGFRAAIRKAIAKIRGKPIGRTPQGEYDLWIGAFEPSEADLRHQSAQVKNLNYQPVISFITPVFNPPTSVLREMMDSVLGQTYDQWELCIADASVGNTEVRNALRAYSEQDSRIKVHFLERNEGISGNSNHAIELATGEYIALLDHDDTLAPNALFEVVTLLNGDPETDLIYFDEDKLSSDGLVRNNPWFKPNWSPELLLSANYLMHSVIRRGLVSQVGGFDPSMDGAQDWDLVLKCTERTENIKHIPKVLYHWRQVEGSAASDLLAKPWAFENQLRVINAHLDRIGIKQGEAFFDSPGFLRVRWPTGGSKVSIIIPTRDRVEILKKCLTSIKEKTDYSNYEIIIVDNESRDRSTVEYYHELKREKNLTVISFPGVFNYSAANNIGAENSTGDILLFLNNDVEILESDWLEELVRWAELDDIGIVGAKLLYPDRTIQHAGVIVGMQGHGSHVFMGSLEKQTGPFGSVDWYRDYSAVTGACMMARNEVFELAGGFDESYQLVFSDVEFCIRVRDLGYRVLYNPFVRIRHFEGQSRGQNIPAKDIRTGYLHLKDLVDAGDGYFNPNLSYARRIPSLRHAGEISRLERLEEIVAHHTMQENE